MRVGFGYDSHRFDPERPLLLAGVLFPDHPGLLGHSDGDAVAHALTDALFGALAEGDIGRHFPPSDPRWKGADSMRLLDRAVEVMRDRGFALVNADITVISETPKIGPRADEMARALEAAVGSGRGSVSVKGKTNEGMGWIGAGEGLAVHAVVLLAPSITP